MNKWLLCPPIAFIVVFVFTLLLSKVFSGLALRKDKKDEGAGKSYACGEDVPSHIAQPDYSQFFPFAFFFTIAHVATLMLTTVPKATLQSFIMADIYIACVMVGLSVLFRREF